MGSWRSWPKATQRISSWARMYIPLSSAPKFLFSVIAPCYTASLIILDIERTQNHLGWARANFHMSALRCSRRKGKASIPGTDSSPHASRFIPHPDPFVRHWGTSDLSGSHCWVVNGEGLPSLPGDRLRDVISCPYRSSERRGRECCHPPPHRPVPLCCFLPKNTPPRQQSCFHSSSRFLLTPIFLVSGKKAQGVWQKTKWR